jgi:ATP-dependent DNA helicase
VSQAERAQLRHEHLPIKPNVDADFPVICTSFEIIIRDRKFLQNYTFKYLVVDEGHRLKNFDCMLVCPVPPCVPGSEV